MNRLEIYRDTRILMIVSSQQQHRERQRGCSEGRTNYTEENNRFKMTQSCMSNGRGVNVTLVLRRVDSNIVLFPCQ